MPGQQGQMIANNGFNELVKSQMEEIVIFQSVHKKTFVDQEESYVSGSPCLLRRTFITFEQLESYELVAGVDRIILCCIKEQSIVIRHPFFHDG